MKRIYLTFVFLYGLLIPCAYGESVEFPRLGYTYTGKLVAGLPNGHGTAIFKGEEEGKYVGYWKDGSRHGFGSMGWSDGRRYVGQWDWNVFHGKGRYRNPPWIYEGEWKNAKHHGQGILYLNTGSHIATYEGAFREGRKHGEGVFTLEGIEIVGEWMFDKQWNTVTYDLKGRIMQHHANGVPQSINN